MGGKLFFRDRKSINEFSGYSGRSNISAKNTLKKNIKIKNSSR